VTVLLSDQRSIHSSEDVVGVRQSVRQRAVELGFSLVDQTKLVTAASELARNALEHGGGGEGEILAAETSGRAGVRLIVDDDGPGIAPEDRERIFDRFYRADPARSGPGAGLGLAVTRSIVVVHGGEIRAAARPGHGTLFRVTLPLAG